MAGVADLIKKVAAEAAAGNIDIPDNLKEKVLGGVSDSIFDSIKKTAASNGGIEQITNLLSGETSASSSPITSMATQIFSSKVAPKLGLSSAVTSTITAMLPTVVDKLIAAVSSGKDGFSIADIISAVSGGSGSSSSKASILKGVGGLLGKLFKK
ncbi:MAG: hypothetical protein IJY54_06920 [Paludibacteraceae bacterium]|nr:hypothetical protein [Bacteroidales bacterium]MBQ9101091.1 hypothetical protein [Paludibacteraceae bacterium]